MDFMTILALIVLAPLAITFGWIVVYALLYISVRLLGGESGK